MHGDYHWKIYLCALQCANKGMSLAKELKKVKLSN